MDGSGIDFVEADFGNEGGMQSPVSSGPQTAAEWDKWMQAPNRAPIGPLLVIGLSILLVVAFPFLADLILKSHNTQPAEIQPQANYATMAPGYDQQFGRPAK